MNITDIVNKLPTIDSLTFNLDKLRLASTAGNVSSGAAYGAVTGAGLGLLNSAAGAMTDEEKRKHWIRNTLKNVVGGAALGTAAGGVAGAGYGAAKTMYNNYNQPNN